jgi:hypothetical protein
VARFERPRIAWYGDMTFMPHFARYLSGGGVTCDVYCGEPIRVRPEMDRKTAARLTEAAVRRLAAEVHGRRPTRVRQLSGRLSWRPTMRPLFSWLPEQDSNLRPFD